MEKYLEFEHKKELRFGARVSLRSNLVLYALKNNVGIKISHNEKIMTLEVEDLKMKGSHNSNTMFIAKFDGYGIKKGEKYYLIDFTFRSDEERKDKPNVNQLQLI